jgi:prepilin-type N-terminal cleavage/methylation domain-containing protein
MNSVPPKNCCGFSLLECAVATSVFALLVAIFSGRALFYHSEAERVVSEQLLGTLRTALQVRAAQLVTSEGERGLERLADQNPMSLLSEKPDNYLGEFYRPDLRKLPHGNWFFDRRDRNLVYLPTGYKSFSLETSRFLRFKVKLILLPDADQARGLSKRTKGVTLDQVTDRVAVNSN